MVTWWQCPAWRGSDSAWHGVTESVTRPSVRLSPPFRLLLSSPHYRWHNMQLCKTPRKVFCNRVEIFKCCAIFKVQSLWGFPQFPGSSPALLESAGHGRGMRWVSDEVFSIDGLPFTLHTFTKCFQLSCFAPGSPPRPGTTRPSSRDIQTLAISCSLSHWRHLNIKQQVLSICIWSFYKVYYHDYLVWVHKTKKCCEKLPISAIHDETQMRDGDTGRAWPVRAEGSSCVVTSGLWTGQRLRHDNTQRKDTYTETGDILLIFWVTSEAWRRVTRAQWALTISRINHHQRVTQIFSERKKFFCNFSCCQVLQCCHCWSLLQSNSYFMHISKFCLHILWLQKNSVSLISVGTESRFRDSIVRLMSSCYLGWWILTHVLVWISHWLSFQWMSVIPHLSIVLISSWWWFKFYVLLLQKQILHLVKTWS